MKNSLILLLLLAVIPAHGRKPKHDKLSGVHVLPEFVYTPGEPRALHILAFVRDSSSLTTYTDTVILFREKWVDFMLPERPTKKISQWRRPRVLTTKSYYRFKDYGGLDSVSDKCSHHFSWSDWIGMIKPVRIPAGIGHGEVAADTLRGRYRPYEIWHSDSDAVTLKANVLADTIARRWVPDISLFFRDDIDFDEFKVNFTFSIPEDGIVRSRDIEKIDCKILSQGRGHPLFNFHKPDRPFFVETYSQVYIIDKAYISIDEAKEWEKVDLRSLSLRPPSDIVPDKSAEALALIARVEGIDHDGSRLDIRPDSRLGRPKPKRNFGQAVWRRLTNMVTGPIIKVHDIHEVKKDMERQRRLNELEQKKWKKRQ